MNKVILSGNLTKDVELRVSKGGSEYCRFTIAVRKNKEITEFFDLMAFGTTAKMIAEYFGKGSKILIDGCLQINKYEKEDGSIVKQVQIVVNNFDFCGGKRKDEERPF